MDDRTLLELAAKAAGLRLEWQRDILRASDDGCVWEIWNPLQRDGDALRLAVKLGMKVVIALGCVRVQCGDANVFESFPSTDATGYVAACRAIVRAAAEIGRTK